MSADTMRVVNTSDREGVRSLLGGVRLLLTAASAREARAMMGLSVEQVAHMAGIAPEVVSRIETPRRTTALDRRLLQVALESQGIRFTSTSVSW